MKMDYFGKKYWKIEVEPTFIWTKKNQIFIAEKWYILFKNYQNLKQRHRGKKKPKNKKKTNKV